MQQKELQNLSTPQSLFQTGPPLVAPFLGTIGIYHLIPVIWTLSLQSLSKVSPRTDLGHLSRSGQDHSSREPHPKLRKRRPWALGLSSIPGPKPWPHPAGNSRRDTALFSPFFMISVSGVKESFGPGKENNSLKGPC